MEINQEKLDKGGPAPFWQPLLHPLSAVKVMQWKVCAESLGQKIICRQ